ncbi:unnamed protein product, partial [Trichogramma brassicae]
MEERCSPSVDGPTALARGQSNYHSRVIGTSPPNGGKEEGEPLLEEDFNAGSIWLEELVGASRSL